MTQTTQPLPNVSIEPTSDGGFIIKIQQVNTTPMQFVAPVKVIGEDFPTMIQKLATVFNVTLTAEAITSAITASQSVVATPPTTTAPAVTS